MVKKKRIKEGDILYISEFEKPLSNLNLIPYLMMRD